ncbi:MAG: sulfatase-like hydrolase/transferase [Rhodospirillales bacterium]
MSRSTNRPFLDALRGRGFYVATESVGNYMSSHHSVASSLNMIYLDHLTRQLGRDSGNLNPLTELVQDHAIQRLLKGAGYKYFHLGSTWEVSRLNRNADVNFSGRAPNEFLSVLMQTNAIPAIARKWDIQIHWIESKCFRVNAKLDMLKRIAQRDEPTFTFAHLLLPHEPFVFDADGRCLTEKEAEARDWRTNFLAQLHYTNDRILDVVDSLIQASDPPPIIIIQGDEGPYPARFVEGYLRGRKFDWRKEATDFEWRQKMGILNALYLPGVEAEGLHPRITPVNTFRVVFNAYFGTDFALLPDRSFSFTDIDHAYDFFEVTDRIY